MSSISGGTAAEASSSILSIARMSRRGSRASISSQVDKEQLSQALDKIHTSASQSETLTTFNEFSSPPPTSSTSVESKGLADDLLQNGISSLYNRFKGAVVGGKEKTSSAPVNNDIGSTETSLLKNQSASTPPSSNSLKNTSSKGSLASVTSPLIHPTPSRLQSPTVSSFSTHSSSLDASQHSFKGSNTSLPSVSKPTPTSRSQITPLTKSKPSAVIVPTVAPVTVTAFRENDATQKDFPISQSDSPTSINFAIRKSPFSSLAESPRDRRFSTKSDISDRSLTPTLSNFQDRQLVDSRITGGSSADPPIDILEQDGTARQSTHVNTKVVPKDPKDRPDLRVDLPRIPDPLKTTDGTEDAKVSSHASLSSAQASNSPLQFAGASGFAAAMQPQNKSMSKRSAAIDRLTQARLPYQGSRGSSTDRSTAEFSPVTTSAHNSVRHESFSIDDDQNAMFSGHRRIPGTTTSGDPLAVSNRLEQMRKQVLSKEYWMKDETCKECFLCGNSFSLYRRKHHCRTCGCIFDSKCTSTIAGDRFGVQGSLRVCKTCLDIINRRHESSGSEDSGDDAPISTSFFSTHSKKPDDADQLLEGAAPNSINDAATSTARDDTRQFSTPMMAIPARRTGDSSNRRSIILEIDAAQLPRPNSSRSLKSLSGRPSSGHRRMHSKHNFLGRFKTTTEQRAPFRRDAVAEMGKRSKLPAFHDDNIIDPDLAPYMSDDGSSGDEQISIYAAMNGDGGGIPSSSLDNERSGFGSLLMAGKRHRTRPDKSISGISFTSRGVDDGSVNGSVLGHVRTGRRRNLSATSNIIHHSRPSPRSNKMGNLMMKGIGSLGEELMASHESLIPPTPTVGSSRMTRSASMRNEKYPPIELHPTMLRHVENLLRQLLQTENIPHARSWEKALLPIFLRCIDDVNMDIRRGDEIDIRHYVKFKKVPGGRPGDTSYVSGVVFTKKLALKSMPRSIPNPRIVVVSFPIEYSRHRNGFMSLEPIIAQEQEFLRNMVNRIASLRPSVLLVQQHVSGLALQYLSEANITVVSNVKQSVIEAVTRCTETETVSSIDMVTLRSVQVGKSAGFDVKTYVNNEIPGKKKTLVYVSGCNKQLGCTVVLRGANMATLAKIKRVSEFMVYVVYNDMLETSLMRDQFISIPSVIDDSGSFSPGNQQQVSQTISAADPVNTVTQDSTALPNDKKADTGASAELQTSSENPDSESPNSEGEVRATNESSSKAPKLVSAHQSHVNGSHVSQEAQVLEDVPMPTFYSDLVATYQTRILSVSPFVKFMQPYLLARVREQESRLMYLKRLRDQDTYEEQTDDEKAKPQPFQLIKSEMVYETVKKAPKQIMEVLHAVHDAEYDKALHNYETHRRQWENSIQGNVDLFDPYWHQNIVVLYSLICMDTRIPCFGPDVLAIEFYNEHLQEAAFDSDCTLGQYIEDLCESADTICAFAGCERKMTEHCRTYAHGEGQITIMLEKAPAKVNGMQDSILMWSLCKICMKETQVIPMSESAWKYSFGKYLELSFWSSGLRLRAGICPHDFHRDHIRFFGYKNVAVKINYDPIDLLEIVVPRTRVTWKVDNDLKLKNELFTKTEERWSRFIASVKSRIKGINIDSVVPEKSGVCKAEVDKLLKRANEEHESMIRKLQEKYMHSKYYEIVPMNRAVRAMQEKVGEWDTTFADFDRNFFPSERDIRRLATLQLRKVFMDRDESTTSLVSTDLGDAQSDLDEKSTTASVELNPEKTEMYPDDVEGVLASVLDENVTLEKNDGNLATSSSQPEEQVPIDLEREGIQPLDLAFQNRPASSSRPDEVLELHDTLQSESLLDSHNSQSSTEDTSVASSSEASDATTKPPTRSPTIDNTGPKEAPVSTTLPQVTGIPRPTDRKTSRRIGNAVSPPVSRAQSQPVGTLRRAHAPPTMSQRNEVVPLSSTVAVDHPQHDTARISTQDPLKISDRKITGFGMTLKNHRKVGQSLIPRSVQSRRQDSKVSALAKHFDQLSREFEKERMRDRKQRAARATQSRAFPKASSKPIVEVYRNISDAVEERGPSEDDVHMEAMHLNDMAPSIERETSLNQDSTDDNTRSASPSGTILTADTATEADLQQPEPKENHSDDEECTASDPETSLLEDLPGVSDIAASLDNEAITGTEINLELPKHEKTSVMKMLSNFWAERSASGWAQLEYPLGPSDHVFADSDVIVREDEPSSLIAFALSSSDYLDRLGNIRQQGQEGRNMEDDMEGSVDPNHDSIDQAAVETSLLRATGTHLKYQWTKGPAKMWCKIYFAEQFDAVRRKCGVADRIVESLSRCLKWDSKGGKTKSVFLKTLDDRLVLKSLSPIETSAFVHFAPAYFNIMAEALFHDLPTVIAKMLGFYHIVIKNPVTGTEIKWDILVMENLFYDRSPTRIFDLKGSMRNRKIQSTGEQNEVLLDENMVEFIYEKPLFAREHSKKLLRSSVWNDTLFLARQNVMDYSLMVAVDDARKELVVGIIDCIRTFTWDKKLESWIKDKGFVGGGRNRPTVTSPKEYKQRFREAMARYVLQAPSCWHQFKHQPLGLPPSTSKPRTREGDATEEVGDVDRYDT